MKNIIQTLTYLLIPSLLILNACKEELTTASCPRIASLKETEKEPLYKISTYAGANEDIWYVIDGTLCKARFREPHGIVAGSNQSLYISDLGNNNIREISKEGTVSTFAGTPDGGGYSGDFKDGIGTQASLNTPYKIIADSDGTMYVIDQGRFVLRKITPNAQVTTYINSSPEFSGYRDGAFAQAKFGGFASLASAPDNSLYIADLGNNIIRKVSQDNTVTTYAGQKPGELGVKKGYKDGPKADALFEYITDIACDSEGVLYICDKGNRKIRRITKAEMVETVADVDAEFITIDNDGTVYAGGNFQVYKISPKGAVSVIAGNGTEGFKNGIGAEIRFKGIRHLTIHKSYLYINDGYCVRRMRIK